MLLARGATGAAMTGDLLGASRFERPTAIEEFTTGRWAAVQREPLEFPN